MQWTKQISVIAAMALVGAGQLAASPADAKSRNGKPLTVYGQRADADAPTRRVGYGDLNLVTLAGEKTLNKRVGGAVRIVCAESVPNGELREELSCKNFAWSGARPQIARAVMRAREIASTGTSSILPVTISLSVLTK